MHQQGALTMVANTYLQFSLQHHFFDALIDKISEFISAKTLLSSHKIDPLLLKNQTDIASPVVYFGAEIYKKVGDYSEKFEAVMICPELGVKFSTLDEITAWLEQNALTASFIQLDEQQSIIPSFYKQDFTLVTSAILQQWFNFGPFGFHVEWLQEMPNYNANYIARALLYIDKSLSSNEWLLGYGVQSQNIFITEHEPSISGLVNSIDICRPICLLDAHAPFAYINDIAAELVYETLAKGKRKVFKNKQAFKQLLAEQGGLYDEQLLWLIDVLPEAQLQQHAYRVIKAVDEILLKSKEFGVTTLFVNDSHPFSQEIIHFYQAQSLAIAIEKSQFDIESSLNFMKLATSYPFEPLSPLRTLCILPTHCHTSRQQTLASLCLDMSDEHRNLSKKQQYLILSHDLMAAAKEDILQSKVINHIG